MRRLGIFHSTRPVSEFSLVTPGAGEDVTQHQRDLRDGIAARVMSRWVAHGGCKRAWWHPEANLWRLGASAVPGSV